MEKENKMKKRIGISKRKLVITLGILLTLFVITGISGFMGGVVYQGNVNTASIDFRIEEYSGTWVYKDTVTGERVILDEPSSNPDYLYVASSYGQPGTNNYDVDFVFENIYPCIFFKADFIAHYIGSIPVHLTGMTFNADPWLEPYITWRAYSCEWDEILEEFVIGPQIQIGYQLHYCMYIYVEVIVKLPQDNNLQDLNGYFHGCLDVIQWDDYCTKYITLPEEEITMTALTCGDVINDILYCSMYSYFDIWLTDVPDGYDVTNDTVYLGWCIDESTTMLRGTPLPCTLYSSYDPIIDSLYPDDDWDMINYLINHKNESASVQDIQDAIWYFINGGIYPTDEHAIAMVEDALSNGEGFIPGTGQWLAVYVLNDYQQIFIEVDP